MEGGVGGKRRLRRVRGGCILDGDGDGDARVCVCGGSMREVRILAVN